MPTYYPPLSPPFSDELAQDSIGGIVDATLVYVDATPSLGRAAITGDVTVAAGSNAATIPNDTVTYAKMQNVSATSRVLGRKTAGAGDAEELTFSEVLDFVGSAAQGDILYRNASAWVRLGAGTSGKFLQTLGAGANPQWATPGATPGSSIDAIAYIDREWVHQADLDTTAFVSTGLDFTFTGTGSTLADDDTDARWIRITSGAVSGDHASLVIIPAKQRRRWSTTMVMRMKTYSDISSTRAWFGFTDTSPLSTDDPASAHLAAFRYSTVAGDSNWMACVKDGSTLNAQSTGVAVAIDTMYLFRVETDASEIRFYINGTLVYTHTSNLPGLDQSMGYFNGVQTVTAATRSWRYCRMYGRQRG